LPGLGIVDRFFWLIGIALVVLAGIVRAIVIQLSGRDQIYDPQRLEGLAGSYAVDLAELVPCSVGRPGDQSFYNGLALDILKRVTPRRYPRLDQCRAAVAAALRDAGCANPPDDAVDEASGRLASLIRAHFA